MELFNLKAELGDSDANGKPDVLITLEVFGFKAPLPNEGRADLELALALVNKVKDMLNK